MPLIRSDRLLDRFTDLIGESTHVDIAVAWVGPGLAVESLLENLDGVQARIVVGLSGNATEPTTLRVLMAEDNVALRVASAPSGGGLFHPKFYRFRSAQRATCWIGSANFTRGGFGGNAELVHEFRDENDIGGNWFEELWAELDEDPESAVSDYEERYKPPGPGRRNRGRPVVQRDLPRLDDVETWEEFVAALRVLDDYCHHYEFGWDVLGETHSYLHTIGVGMEVVRRASWERWSLHDRNILMGLESGAAKGQFWGLLGSMRGAGMVVGAFAPEGNSERRAQVHKQVQRVVRADEDEIVDAADAAIAGIRQLHGFGAAVATRLLALARPDRLVSVNGPSAPVLGGFAGLPKARDPLAAKYGKLLTKIHDREWCKAPEPTEAGEREIWRCRAALLDAFVHVR
ncbi:MAG: phospholipase D family protein [Boseongicola sp.]|nr:phospholipase D family protein [Boseongicola sp.]